MVPCPNAKYGCAEKFSYGKELAHEKECGLALCHCPVPNCNFTGMYKDLYGHQYDNHKALCNSFTSGRSTVACLRMRDKILVLQESCDGPLVAVQCFKAPIVFYVTVNCIAPCAPGVGEFSYHISYSYRGKTLTFELEKMNRIQKVSYETPEKDFMLVPYYILDLSCALKMRICIRRL
ncbi:unnamed protein product [Microthlaspi erraticum]|uniref:SIAH-type domain-containing protein n=1 Tax=Microthlaspi erraticum TaxID=1685480 RepID=A0A6D2IQV6_9BRAS|nr:unnamed protein product [Microthlaspi erraticum]